MAEPKTGSDGRASILSRWKKCKCQIGHRFLHTCLAGLEGSELLVKVLNLLL
jgi:hypothetical protein